MSAPTTTRRPSQRHFLTPAGTIAVYESHGIAPGLNLTYYPNTSVTGVRSMRVEGDDAHAVALAVRAGDMPAIILADWFEDRGYSELAGNLRHPETVDKDAPRLFELGQIQITPGARGALREATETHFDLIFRHVRGNWGCVSADDKAANDASVRDGSRIISAYTLSTGTKVWVLTEAEGDDGVRAMTTVLLPEEY